MRRYLLIMVVAFMLLAFLQVTTGGYHYASFIAGAAFAVAVMRSGRRRQ